MTYTVGSGGTVANYTDLQAAVIDLLNRPDLAGQAPFWIQLAEAQFNRTIRHRQMLTHATATISAEYVPTPPDFLGVQAFSITSTTPTRTLKFVTPTQANQLASRRFNVAEQPDSYSIVGTSFRFSSVPDQGYTADLQYWAQIPSLVSNSTNWLLSLYPDAYLYGAAIQAIPFVSDDDRLPGWLQIYQGVIEEINQANLKESTGDVLRQVHRFAP
jgi:hypothetical protein